MAVAAAMALVPHDSVRALENPRSIKVDAQSSHGVLLLAAPTTGFGYKLTLQKEGSGGFGSRVYFVSIARAAVPAELKYETRELPAGRYVLKYVMQQNAWIGCLEHQTFLIEIAAGRVNYLGYIDPRGTLEGIQAAAVAAGELTGGGGRGGGSYYDLPSPTLGGRDAAGLAQARAFVAANMPKARAAVELSAVQPYAFRRPDDRNRRKRDCS
jgi:hypothetical protein